MKTLHLIRGAALTAFVALAQGCATLGIGEDEFSCSGLPEGTRCMSVRSVYDNTHNGNVPRGVVEDEGNQAVDEDAKPEIIRRDLVDHYIAPDMPNRPTPIRTPAKVMRIWVAPYQDLDNDLVSASYIYTEIEERKWLYDAPIQTQVRLSPIQTLPPEDSGANSPTKPVQ